MSYLLSNGRITNNQLDYIKDMIFFNMKILKDEVPFFDGGSEELIPDIVKGNISEHVSRVISKILERVNLQFPELKISLDLIILDYSCITVQLTIDGSKVSYDIKRRN